MSIRQSYIVLGFTTLLSIIATIRSGPNATILKVEKYLSEFGYLPPSQDNSGNSIQKFANTNVTGEFHKETKKLVLPARCGVRDKDLRNSNRRKRFVPQGSRLDKSLLTYNIVNYPSSLKRHEVDKEIHRAFSLWSQHVPLKIFRKYYGDVDFKISFQSGDHGDYEPFTGRGNILAHAFFPSHGSEIHFDADEEWTIGTNRGTNLFQLAVHEIGHALGLMHSDVDASVMYPFYYGYNLNFKLHNDDIVGIQYLYSHKELCYDPKVDAVFKSADNYIYIFKSNKYYKLAGYSVLNGYPKLTSYGWPGLPDDIDAAFAYKNDKTYFFKDTKYWQFTGSQMDAGYPREISEDFRGVPNHLDAAMYSEELNIIYFFKGHQLWQLDAKSRQQISNNIPSWKDLPSNVDAAFTDNTGLTYFFKDNKFYAIRNTDIPGKTIYYRYSTTKYWFGC